MKIKILMLFLYQKVFLRKDNLAKKINKVVRNVLFVIKMIPYNIFRFMPISK
jgi:hypothetical protein